MEQFDVVKKIGNTDYNYKILTLGVKGGMLPAEKKMMIFCNWEVFGCKVHSSVKGRIDGLAEFYRSSNLQIGDEIGVKFDLEDDQIFVTVISRVSDTLDDLDALDDSNSSETVDDAEVRKNIFEGLDPVVYHGEYFYGSGFEKPSYLAVNNEYVITRSWEQKLCLSHESDMFNKIDISDIDIKDTVLFGFNNYGVWFLKNKIYHEEEMLCKIICVNPWEKTKREWKMNGKNAYVNVNNIYIYGDQIFYISEKGTKSYIIKLLSNSVEMEIFVANKDEKLSHLSVHDERLAFQFVSRKANGGTYWYIYSIYGGEEQKIGQPSIEIKSINLKKGVMWTRLTERERNYLGIESKGVLIARSIGQPVEGRYRVYKNTKTPVTFTLPSSYCRLDYCYFDGNDYYEAPHYSHLKRSDRQGGVFNLGPMGHGETRKIAVSEKYLYVNYDASMPVRLPRKFSESRERAEENVEAFKLWGNNDYRL